MRNLYLVFNRIFILGGNDQTEESWEKLFEPYGQIHQVLISKDRDTGKKKGITYIRFERTSEACKAIEEMNGEYIGNNKYSIKVVLATEKYMRIAGKNTFDTTSMLRRICIKVPKTFKIDDVKRRFREYGKILYVYIPRHPDGSSKARALVKFEKQSSAARAMEECEDMYQPIWGDVMALNERPHERYMRPEDYPPQDPCPVAMGGAPIEGPDMGGPGMGGPGMGWSRMGGPMGGAMGGTMGMMDEPMGPYDGPMGPMDGPMGPMDGPMGPMRSMNDGMGSMDSGYGGRGGTGKQFQSMEEPEDSGLGLYELEASLPPGVTSSQAYALFDIAQGMKSCVHDMKTGLINVVYNNEANAAHAREKISGMDYAGRKISVRYKIKGGVEGIKNSAAEVQNRMQTMVASGTANERDLKKLMNQLKKINDVIEAQTEVMEASQNMPEPEPEPEPQWEKVAFCNKKLPRVKPKSPMNSDVMERLFFKLSGPVPASILEDVFCRFGNFVRCSYNNEKDFGYAHFADSASAMECVETINMGQIMNAQIMFQYPDSTPMGRPPVGGISQSLGGAGGGAEGYTPMAKRQAVGYPNPASYSKQQSSVNAGFGQRNTGFQQSSLFDRKRSRYT